MNELITKIILFSKLIFQNILQGLFVFRNGDIKTQNLSVYETIKCFLIITGRHLIATTLFLLPFIHLFTLFFSSAPDPGFSGSIIRGIEPLFLLAWPSLHHSPCSRTSLSRRLIALHNIDSITLGSLPFCGQGMEVEKRVKRGDSRVAEFAVPWSYIDGMVARARYSGFISSFMPCRVGEYGWGQGTLNYNPLWDTAECALKIRWA